MTRAEIEAMEVRCKAIPVMDFMSVCFGDDSPDNLVCSIDDTVHVVENGISGKFVPVVVLLGKR